MMRYSNIKPLKWMVVLFFMTSIPFQQALAETQAESNSVTISTYDPSSNIAVNYDTWSLLLKATVTRARLSSRRYAQKSQASIGTKVSYSSNKPTRMEASRVYYHYIKKEEMEYVHALRLGMEALPQAVPLQNLNRAEQLAYWLNLYNITVYEQVAKRYPIRKLKKLFKGSRKTPSMWDEKLLNVNSIPLSLNDIQYNIIQKIWPDPIVIYGLYQGTIGGPNLRRKAYTGKLVYEQLEDNAEEFINSLRGLRFKGKTAQVSEIYKWNSDLFPNFNQDLRRHLRQFTNYKLTSKLDSSKKVKAKIYDWHVADMLNGGRSPAGGAGSTNPVAFLTSPGTMEADDFGSGGQFTYFGGGGMGNIAMDTAIIRARLPKNAAMFLKEFVQHNRQLKKSNVTVEEIEKKDLEKTKPEKEKK